MRPLSWTEGAIADLDHIRRYVSAFDHAAARRLADRIAAVAGLLESDDLPEGVQERSIVPPFLLRFRIGTDGAIIHAVRHSNHARIL